MPHKPLNRSSRLASYETSSSTEPDVRLFRIRLFIVLMACMPLCACRFLLRNIFPAFYLSQHTVSVYPEDIALCSCLPSGGIAHLPQYYAAVRLPAVYLYSFVPCHTYHLYIRMSPSDMETTGSPQLMQCHCAAWLTSNAAGLRTIPSRTIDNKSDNAYNRFGYI